MTVKKTPLERAIEKKETSSFAIGLKISSEFLSAVLIGVALGLASDKYLTHSPWGLIVFLLLGTAAGFLNVMRYAAKENLSDKKSE